MGVNRASNREIAVIALPALGTLAAEPLYLLVDTAIVGHLGTVELASLALAVVVLGAVVNLCNFLAYGTTGRVARLVGAGQSERAGADGIQALWLGLAIGLAVAIVCIAAAVPIMDVLAGSRSDQVASAAARYLQLSAFGLPFALAAVAAQGYLRGIADLRGAVVVLIVANVVNAVLEVLFVYGLSWGLDGSAIGTVIAQFGMATALVALVLARARGLGLSGGLRPRLAQLWGQLEIGVPIMIRTGALLAAFITMSAVLARVGPDSLAAHQIAFQTFILLALVLDAVAIAAQVLIAGALGAADRDLAIGSARRICLWALGAGTIFAALLMAGRNLIPQAFTRDDDVLDRCAELWPLFALMMPIGGVVFAFDGILLGAGDLRYLALAMVVSTFCVFLPISLMTLHFGWGVRGAWWGIIALMLARFATLGPRLLRGRWLRTGAT